MAKKKTTPANEAEATKTPAAAPAQDVPGVSRIVELYVENVMKVRVAHIKPKGNVIQVTGKNGQGKTSVLRAIAWGLTGTTDIPSQPIRAGQRTGKVKIDLGDLTVTRHFTRVDQEKSAKDATYITKLTVEGKKREQFRSPQSVLDALMGKISFDPLAFTRMDDKKQLETLRGLVTFDIDIDALDLKQKEDYDERTIAGRQVDSAATRLESLAKPQDNLPQSLIDTVEITKRLEGAANHNNIVMAQRQKKLQLEEEAEAAARDAGNLRLQAYELMKQATALDGQEQALKPLQPADGPNEVARLKALSAAIAPADEINTAAVVEDLTRANELNRQIAHAKRYAEAEEELRVAKEKWDQLDMAVKNRTIERAKAITRAKMPIEHLGIGDGEVLYKELPFSQASNAEQIRVSMALAMASNPKLRVLRISDGSLLDDDSMELLTTEAEKNGFQVWIERVDSSGRVGVVMEDGEASGDDVVSEEKF